MLQTRLRLLEQGGSSVDSMLATAPREATDVTRQPPAFQFGKASPISGYGYQFWLGAVPGRFAMIGIRGQSMYIDQGTRKVILINSAGEYPVDKLKSLARYNMFQAYVAGAGG